MQLEVVDPLDLPDWDDWVQGFQEYTFFHSSAWARVLTQTYKYRPCYLVAHDTRVCGVLPLMDVRSPFTGRRGVSLPFSDFCAPLFNGDEALRVALVERAVKLALRRRWRYLEIRSEVPGRLFRRRRSFVEHVIKLDRDLQSIRTGLRGSAWRNILKAERAGIRIHLHTDLSAVRQFYRLHCQTRKRQGLPIQPEALFNNLHAFCIGQGNGFVLLARHNSRTIAGGLYLHLGRKAVYKYGASLLEFQAMRPNNVVMWDAICRYQAMGMESLSFGRTELDDAGLLQYKDGWGGSRKVTAYSRWDTQGDHAAVGHETTESRARRILSKAPVQLLRLLGELVYPHLG